MHERSSCRIYGCIERRQLGSAGNGKGSLETSDRFDEGNDGHHKGEADEGKGTVVFGGNA